MLCDEFYNVSGHLSTPFLRKFEDLQDIQFKPAFINSFYEIFKVKRTQNEIATTQKFKNREIFLDISEGPLYNGRQTMESDHTCCI